MDAEFTKRHGSFKRTIRRELKIQNAKFKMQNSEFRMQEFRIGWFVLPM